jgi:hypothetical protein
MITRPVLLAAAAVIVFIAMASSPALAAAPFRVLTEDASVLQCAAERCITVQVTRSTFSNGHIETTLVVSRFDLFGNVLGGFSRQIDNHAFAMEAHGRRATLDDPDAAVTWQATDEFLSVSDSTERVIDNRGFDFSLSHRLTERGEQRSATAFGTVGGVAISIERALPAGGSAFLSLSRARSSP